jgi:hypothetical protein
MNGHFDGDTLIKLWSGKEHSKIRIADYQPNMFIYDPLSRYSFRNRELEMVRRKDPSLVTITKKDTKTDSRSITVTNEAMVFGIYDGKCALRRLTNICDNVVTVVINPYDDTDSRRRHRAFLYGKKPAGSLRPFFGRIDECHERFVRSFHSLYETTKWVQKLQEANPKLVTLYGIEALGEPYERLNNFVPLIRLRGPGRGWRNTWPTPRITHMASDNEFLRPVEVGELEADQRDLFRFGWEVDEFCRTSTGAIVAEDVIFGSNLTGNDWKEAFYAIDEQPAQKKEGAA